MRNFVKIQIYINYEEILEYYYNVSYGSSKTVGRRHADSHF